MRYVSVALRVMSLFMLLAFMPLALAQEDAVAQDRGDIAGDTAVVAVFDIDPGLTPDSPFYFLDELFERPGSNPEKALKFKEEKIAEALVMIEKGKAEEARNVLEKAQRYAGIMEKEVTPEMKEKVRQRKDVIERALVSVEEESVEADIAELLEQEERIVQAADVASGIERLCRTLSKLDPGLYAENCRTDDAAPKWQQEFDQELTAEQQEKAEYFKEMMLRCIEDPAQCPCDTGIVPFDQACRVESSLFAQCREGDENACSQMGRVEIDLPEYLMDVLQDLEDEFSAKFAALGIEHRFERREEAFPGGALPGDVPATVMREMQEFMQECQQERSTEECMQEARDQFAEQFPSGMVPPGQLVRQGPPARIVEFGRDCHALQDTAEKARCFEDFYNQASVRYVEYRIEFEEEFEDEFEDERDERRERFAEHQFDERQREFYEQFRQASEEERQHLKEEFWQRFREERSGDEVRQEFEVRSRERIGDNEVRRESEERSRERIRSEETDAGAITIEDERRGEDESRSSGSDTERESSSGSSSDSSGSGDSDDSNSGLSGNGGDSSGSSDGSNGNSGSTDGGDSGGDNGEG